MYLTTVFTAPPHISASLSDESIEELDKIGAILWKHNASVEGGELISRHEHVARAVQLVSVREFSGDPLEWVPLLQSAQKQVKD